MSTSTDADHFFQTTQSIAEITRKKSKSANQNGAPIRLPSKILAVIADPVTPFTVFVAESAGSARRVMLETGESTHQYRGPETPITSLALSVGSRSDGSTLFAGSWDKSVWSWGTQNRAPKRRYFGHTDFVKSVLCLSISGKEVLLSGGADAVIILWDVLTGQKLHVLRGGHTRGVLDLAVDPLTYPIESAESDVVLFSAGSDREIRRWRISSDISHAREIERDKVIIQHETGVYRLVFDADDDLWTASADGTAKRISRAQQFTSDTTLPHGDYVRSVAIDERGGYVVTVGRDEDVKIWDSASGMLCHTYSGHFEEITGCVVIGQNAVTVSIDATIRQWSLLAHDLEKAKQEAEKVNLRMAEEAVIVCDKLTEDEDRELAELMDNDE